MPHAGELTSLLTAIFWTITALAFEASGKRIGSMAVNLYRLIIGYILLSIFTWIYRGSFFPADATGDAWRWLTVSGLIGFTFGDLCLFQAFVVIGARISMLLMALSPLFTALAGWIILGEEMTVRGWIGMSITLSGIMIVVLTRKDVSGNGNILKNLRLSYPIWGILLGLGGAIGQAVGLVLSKYAMKGYDPFASAQIRVLAGIAGFVVAFFIFGYWKKAYKALSDKKAMGQLSLGAFFGPFLGVSFSLLSVQLTNTGIAATIMAMVPVFIIIPAVIIFKEKVTVKEVIGALIAVGGVAVFFV